MPMYTHGMHGFSTTGGVAADFATATARECRAQGPATGIHLAGWNVFGGLPRVRAVHLHTTQLLSGLPSCAPCRGAWAWTQATQASKSAIKRGWPSFLI